MTVVIDAPDDRVGVIPDWLVAAWVDHWFGLAACAGVRPGSVPATASLSLQHLRPAHGPLSTEATVSKTGRTLAFVNVDVRSASGILTTVASGTMSVDGSSLPITAAG